MDKARARRLTEELRGKHIGGWQIQDYAGHGKSAVVFKATKDGQKGALKVFEAELIEKFGREQQKKRVERELSLRGMSHQHLVSILDGGECDKTGSLYVVMEYLPWPNLASAITDAPRESIVEIIRQVASAAQFLEALNIAHRDIKPDNIAVSPDFKMTKLLDLGVIRPVGKDSITDLDGKEFIGTHQYGPPEYVMREEKDTPEGWRAVTFYQLGGVLHDLIMRVRLFEEFTHPFARLVDAIRTQNPRFTSVTDVPPHLVQLASNCLVKNPDVRLQLVKWDDFSGRPIDPRSATGVRDLLLTRMTAAREARKAIAAGDPKELIRRVQDSVCAVLDRITRDICNGNDLLPPAQFHSCEGRVANAPAFLLRFSPSGDHAIAFHLGVYFTVSVLDHLSRAVELNVCAMMGQNALVVERFSGKKDTLLFRGIATEPVLAQEVETVLYRIVNTALELIEAKGTITDEGVYIGLENDTEPGSEA